MRQEVLFFRFFRKEYGNSFHQPNSKPICIASWTCIANPASPRAPLASQRLRNRSQALHRLHGYNLARVDLIGQLPPYIKNRYVLGSCTSTTLRRGDSRVCTGVLKARTRYTLLVTTPLELFHGTP